MRALLESARRHLASVRDELVHQQADARARNNGKPSRVLVEQMHHIDGAIDDIDEAIDEEDARDTASEPRRRDAGPKVRQHPRPFDAARVKP